MKRLLQFVALFVVVLLAVQPALAGLPCAQETTASGACDPDCAMATTSAPMSQMASDCGMAPQVSSNGCEQSCCDSDLIQSVSQPATGAKLNAGSTVQFVAVQLVAANATSAFATPAPVDPVSSAPARYILLQVFRI
jgi:hypothetical protein